MNMASLFNLAGPDLIIIALLGIIPVIFVAGIWGLVCLVKKARSGKQQGPPPISPER
jgi:hypothetical protein